MARIRGIFARGNARHRRKRANTTGIDFRAVRFVFRITFADIERYNNDCRVRNAFSGPRAEKRKPGRRHTRRAHGPGRPITSMS